MIPDCLQSIRQYQLPDGTVTECVVSYVGHTFLNRCLFHRVNSGTPGIKTVKINIITGICVVIHPFTITFGECDGVDINIWRRNVEAPLPMT